MFIFHFHVSYRHRDVIMTSHFEHFWEISEIHENYAYSLSNYFNLNTIKKYGMIVTKSLFCGLCIFTIHSSLLHTMTSKFDVRLNL